MSSVFKVLTGVFALFVLLLPASPARALESGWVSADYVQARLVPGDKTDSGMIDAGLDVRLSDGWHAYWRTPGEGGLPPRLEWNGSDNLEEAKVQWPLPERIETVGLYSFGYEGHIMLPLEIKPAVAGEPVKLVLDASIMVCKDICVPQDIKLKLDLPADSKDSAYEPLIKKAQDDVPHDGDLPALKIENAVAGPQAIVINAYSKDGFDNADLFVEVGNDLYITAKPEITVDEKDPRKAMLRVAAPEGIGNLTEFTMGRLVTLTLTNGHEAIEKTISF